MHPDGSLLLGLAVPLVDVGRSLRESAAMLWDTLWALVLGFTLSGAVQAFVPRRAMERHLGDHGPASVARASLFGMVSSSCSYAAAAMARSLFARGADFVSSMVFMLASTNLVIELGIVLAVLIGWQFVAAEFVGGTVMICLFVLLGGLWLRGRALADARARARGAVEDGGAAAGAEAALEREGWRRRVRSVAGWADASACTVGDLTMLRRELAIGFVAAGFLSTLVPAWVWADVFVHGHGVATSAENAAVGPLVALVSFVCSIGNVPLAAALWHGGVSFGGVVAFVFADLIAAPLLLVYRRQYGGRVAVRLLGVLWVAMAAAGLLTQYLFEAAGLVPSARPALVSGGFTWGWTTWLDLAALAVLAAVLWLSANRERLGGDAGLVEDPVCGMRVDVRQAPPRVEVDGRPVHFCSERCRARFVAGAGGPPAARVRGGGR